MTVNRVEPRGGRVGGLSDFDRGERHSRMSGFIYFLMIALTECRFLPKIRAILEEVEIQDVAENRKTCLSDFGQAVGEPAPLQVGARISASIISQGAPLGLLCDFTSVVSYMRRIENPARASWLDICSRFQ